MALGGWTGGGGVEVGYGLDVCKLGGEEDREQLALPLSRP